MEYTLEVDGSYLVFGCEECGEECRCEEKAWGRTFCDNCGACYTIYTDKADGILQIRRIRYGEMYLPPLEWNNLYGTGLSDGMQLERTTRRQSTFWLRFKRFIRNN